MHKTDPGHGRTSDGFKTVDLAESGLNKQKHAKFREFLHEFRARQRLPTDKTTDSKITKEVL